VTNSYEVSGKILETKVHAYKVEFEPNIPTNEVITRRTILYGDSKQEKKPIQNYCTIHLDIVNSII